MESEHLEKLGGSLVNLILGALILWVGQTTFRHAGMLAGIDQKYAAVETHHDNLRARLDSHIAQLNEKTRSRFTREDGDKLRQQIEEAAVLVDALERRMSDRVTALHLKVIALETQRRDHGELSKLNLEIAQLREELRPQPVYRSGGYVAGQGGVATAPVAYPQTPPVRR